MTAERKRILFLVPAFARGSGGAERVISTLLRHLDHSRFECHLALVGAGRDFLEDLPNEVTVHHLRVSRMRYSLPAIVRLARRLKPQTILSTVIYVNAMLMLGRHLLPGRPKILLRESTLPSAFLATESRYPNITKWLYRRLYRKADRIICLCDAAIDDMVEHLAIPREKLVRIYNPVDVAMVRRLAEGVASPYSSPGPHVVAVGRLQREKAYDVLLQAFPRVLQTFPGARLAILGEGPLEGELKKQAMDLGIDHAVSFPGFQKNPWPYVKHANLYVLASRFEGLPNSLLEVLALGVPVVATDCPGGVREIQKSAPEIVLVPAEDQVALAAGIVAALAKPIRESASSRQVAEQLKDFDLGHVVREYSELF
jgi:glycosyltransferase involved in cell wall biosynthesis